MFQAVATGDSPRPEAEGIGSLVKTTFVLVALVLATSLTMGALAAAASAAQTSQQTAETVQPSITRITVTWNMFVFDDLTDSWTNISFESQCSGFVVDPDGYIATAGHCVDPELASESAIELRAKQLYRQNQSFFENKNITLADLIAYGLKNWKVEGRGDGSAPQLKLEVTVPGGMSSEDPVTYQGEVVDADTTNDVALLKIDASGLPALALADEDDIEIGESIFAVGFPGVRDSVTDPSLRPTFKSGAISDTAATRDEGEVPIYETSAPMGQGMSGGPTVNADGEVVGINSYGTTLNNDFNWIAPSHLLKEMLEANGVDGALDQTDVLYRQALDAFYAEDYRTAAAKLQAVLDELPDHPVALGLIEEAREGAKTQPLPEQPGMNLPLVPFGIALAIIATLGMSFFMGRTFARRMGNGMAPAGGMAMAMPIPPNPVPPRPIPAPPAVRIAVPTTPRVDPARIQDMTDHRPSQTTTIGFQPPAKPQAAAHRDGYCTGCGVPAEAGANFCRRCGTSIH